MVFVSLLQVLVVYSMADNRAKPPGEVASVPDVITNDGKWFVSNKTTVFVRPCYVTLFGLCKSTWQYGYQGVFLKGTPGVGKSYFLDYATHRLLQAGANVLVLSGTREEAALYFANGKPDTCDLCDAVKKRWAEQSDFVLLDPHENPDTTKDPGCPSCRAGWRILAATSSQLPNT